MTYVRVLERDGQQFVFGSKFNWPAESAPTENLLAVDKELTDKCRRWILTDDEFEPVIRALLKGESFTSFLAVPKGVFPVAVLPATLRREFPNHRFLVLTDSVATKMADKHPDITARKYRRIQLVLSRGEVRRPERRSETMRVVYFQKRPGRWWRLVLRFPAGQNAAEIVTYHRITERIFRTQFK